MQAAVPAKPVQDLDGNLSGQWHPLDRAHTATGIGKAGIGNGFGTVISSSHFLDLSASFFILFCCYFIENDFFLLCLLSLSRLTMKDG